MQQLTRSQKRQIAFYLHFQKRPMLLSSLIWFNRRIYALLFIMAVTSAIAAYWAFDVLGVAFVVVAYGTMFLRDIGWYRRSKINWPLIRDLIAWEKVIELKADLDANS